MDGDVDGVSTGARAVIGFAGSASWVGLLSLLGLWGGGGGGSRASDASACLAVRCKYSVRDVGFVAWDDQRATLVLERPLDDPARDESAAVLRSAVRGGPFRVDVRAGPPAVWIDEEPVVEAASSIPGVETLRDAVRPLLDSPSRVGLAEALVQQFAVILLVEGRDQASNDQARAAVADACARLESSLPHLEKPTERGATLRVIDASTKDAERWWLHSLGAPASDGPVVAILFGRARRLGPWLEGEAIDARALHQRLILLGQSCECELDRTYLYGPAGWLRWTPDVRALAASQLTFDPEQPLVVAEVERIVLRGGPGTERRTGSVDDLLLGYREITLDEPGSMRSTNAVDEPGRPAAVDGTVTRQERPPGPVAEESVQAREEHGAASDAPGTTSPSTTSLGATAFRVLGVIAVLVAGGAGFIGWQRRNGA